MEQSTGTTCLQVLIERKQGQRGTLSKVALGIQPPEDSISLVKAGSREVRQGAGLGAVPSSYCELPNVRAGQLGQSGLQPTARWEARPATEGCPGLALRHSTF